MNIMHDADSSESKRKDGGRELRTLEAPGNIRVTETGFTIFAN